MAKANVKNLGAKMAVKRKGATKAQIRHRAEMKPKPTKEKGMATSTRCYEVAVKDGDNLDKVRQTYTFEDKKKAIAFFDRLVASAKVNAPDMQVTDNKKAKDLYDRENRVASSNMFDVDAITLEAFPCDLMDFYKK